MAGLLACTLVLLVAVALVASAGYLRGQREPNARSPKGTLPWPWKPWTTSTGSSPDRTAPASASLRVNDAEDPITLPVQPVLSKEAAALLEHMLKFYDRLADQGGDDARLRRKVAEANRRVGDIRRQLGQYAESKAAYVRAIELYTRLADSSAKEPDLRTEIARIHNELGNVYYAMNDAEAGRKSHLDALAMLARPRRNPRPRPTASTSWRGPATFWASGAAARRDLLPPGRAARTAARPVSSSTPVVRTTDRILRKLHLYGPRRAPPGKRRHPHARRGRLRGGDDQGEDLRAERYGGGGGGEHIHHERSGLQDGSRSIPRPATSSGCSRARTS